MRISLQIGEISMRPFSRSPSDTRELYAIRNHPSVRPFMSKPELIPYRSHLRCVERELLGRCGLLLWLVRPRPEDRAVGFTQLRLAGGTGEIGAIFREPDRHQVVTTMAAAATVHVAFKELHLERLISYVLPTHAAAIRFNKGFGAWEEPSDVPGMTKLRLDRTAFEVSAPCRRLLGRLLGRLRVVHEAD